MEKLVSIATFSTAFEAELLQKKIQDLGFFCVVQDLNTINMNFFYANALGGIKVQVEASNFEKIKNLLNIEEIELNDDTEVEE